MKKIQDKLKEADERDQAISIPPVTLTGIVQLHQILKQQNYDPSSIANAILSDIDYLDNLFELAEKLPENDYKHKHLFFEIFKLIILLNESNLLEILFTENYILRLMAVLERVYSFYFPLPSIIFTIPFPFPHPVCGGLSFPQ